VGAAPAGEPLDGWHYLPVAHRAVGVTPPWQPVTPGEGTEVWTCLMKQQEEAKDATERAVVTHRAHGKGAVTAIHCNLFRDYHKGHAPLQRDFVRHLVDRLGIAWEVEVDAPPSLEVVTRSQGGKLAINLINRGAGEMTSPRRVQFDDLPPVTDVTITVRQPERPLSVTLEPSADPVPWTWTNGMMSIQVPVIRIHDIVVVE
jgi:hypothetical protein